MLKIIKRLAVDPNALRQKFSAIATYRHPIPDNLQSTRVEHLFTQSCKERIINSLCNTRLIHARILKLHGLRLRHRLNKRNYVVLPNLSDGLLRIGDLLLFSLKDKLRDSTLSYQQSGEFPEIHVCKYHLTDMLPSFSSRTLLSNLIEIVGIEVTAHTYRAEGRTFVRSQARVRPISSKWVPDGSWV